MARIKNGLLSGIIGDFVGYQVKGKQFMRRRPVRKAEPSEALLLSNHMFALAAQWVKPLLPFVRIGFRNYNENFEGYNAAVSVIRLEALQKDGYNSWIDPAKARVSHGSLPLPTGLQAQLQPDGRIDFSWDPSGVSGCSPRDRVMLLVYNVGKKFAVPQTFGNIRHAGSDSLQLPPDVTGTFHLYAAFIAEDLSRQSNSVYLGEVERRLVQ